MIDRPVPQAGGEFRRSNRNSSKGCKGPESVKITGISVATPVLSR